MKPFIQHIFSQIIDSYLYSGSVISLAKVAIGNKAKMIFLANRQGYREQV